MAVMRLEVKVTIFKLEALNPEHSSLTLTLTRNPHLHVEPNHSPRDPPVALGVLSLSGLCFPYQVGLLSVSGVILRSWFGVQLGLGVVGVGEGVVPHLHVQPHHDSRDPPVALGVFSVSGGRTFRIRWACISYQVGVLSVPGLCCPYQVCTFRIRFVLSESDLCFLYQVCVFCIRFVLSASGLVPQMLHVNSEPSTRNQTKLDTSRPLMRVSGLGFKDFW